MPKDMSTNLLSGWAQTSNNGHGLHLVRHFAQPVECTVTGGPVATRGTTPVSSTTAHRHQLLRLAGHCAVTSCGVDRRQQPIGVIQAIQWPVSPADERACVTCGGTGRKILPETLLSCEPVHA